MSQAVYAFQEHDQPAVFISCDHGNDPADAACKLDRMISATVDGPLVQRFVAAAFPDVQVVYPVQLNLARQAAGIVYHVSRDEAGRIEIKGYWRPTPDAPLGIQFRRSLGDFLKDAALIQSRFDARTT